MKNKLMLNMSASIFLLGLSAQADMSMVKGMKAEKILCENGTQGFTVEIERDSVNKVVEYSSCVNGTLVIKDRVEEELVPIRLIDKGGRVSIN